MASGVAVSRSKTRQKSPAPARAEPTWTPGALEVHVGDLRALGEEQLCRVLALRPDLAVPPPSSLAELEERSMSPHSVLRALMGADVLVLQLAQILTIIGERHTSLERVLELVGDVPEGEVRRGLSWLEDRHLLSEISGSNICVHASLLSIGGAAALGPPAATLVDTLSITDLRFIMKTLGRKSSATRKAAMVEELLTLVTDQEAVRTLVAGAPAEVRDYALRVAKGSTSIRLPWNGHDDPYRSAPGSGATDAPLWLLQRGLAYKDAWLTAVMPREVGLALRGGVPFPASTYRRPQIGVQPVAAPAPFAAEGRVSELLQAVERVIDAWGSKPAALLKNDGIGVREVRRLSGVIGMSERDTFRLIEIAAAADLIVADTRQGLAMPTPAGDEWMDLGEGDRWWALANSWLETPMYPSLAGVEGERNKAIPALGYPLDYESEAAGQRHVVLRAMLGLPEGSGAGAEALAEAVLWDAPMLWHHSLAGPEVVVGWVMDEMELLGLTLGGAPSPLAHALVEGDLHAARSLLGDPCAGAWRLVLQADLTALATGRVPSSVRAELEVLADVEGRGSATLYRFSEGSVRRAFDAGHSSAQVLAFLEEHAAKGVPQPLIYLVKDVERRHGQVRLGRAGCYVRFEDPALAAEVVRGSRTSKLGLRQIAPTVLVCDQPNDVVLKALRTAGYLPVAESKDGSVVHTPLTRHRAQIERSTGHTLYPAARRASSTSGAASRGRSQLSTGGAAEGSGSPDHRALIAELLRSAGESSGAPKVHQDHGRPGSGTGSGVEIPTMLRRPAPEADDLLGPLGEIEDLIDFLTSTDWDPDDDEGVIEELFGGEAHSSGERERPTEIFHSREEIALLLELAEEEEWLVRLSYTSAVGKPSEVTVVVRGLTGSVMLAQVAPRWTDQKYLVERIVWARALTEAEEEMLW